MSRLQKLLSAPVRESRKIIAYKMRNAVKRQVQRVSVQYLKRPYITGHSPVTARFSNNIRFFSFSEFPQSKAAFREIMQAEFPNAIRQAIDLGDKDCTHTFDLLGSGQTSLGEKIDWHKDFKSGHAWPIRYFEDLPEVNLNDSSDIKVPWELSRFYHAITLGKAYFWTGNDKYCQEFLDQVDSWRANNQVYYGVNWRLAMEVAIRAVNWIWGYNFMRESPLFTRDRENQLAASLFEHGRYIFDNLEFDKRLVSGKHRRVNGNHYMSNLAGLAYIGLVLEGREPKRWLDFAKAELIEEIEEQFLPDGAQWELTTSYHRLVTEMCLSSLILLSENGHEFPAKTRNRLIQALAYTKAYTRPDGLAPLIRDADDGRLYIFDQEDFRDHRHLLALGAVLFDRADLLLEDKNYSEETLWLLGTTGYAKYRKLSGARTERTSEAFENAGYYFLRGNRFQAMVTCAEVGMLGTYGGHSHSDCLSFELSFGKRTLITDCGSYVYSASPEWRNRFRSTEFHNTVRVDSTDISLFNPAQLFSMENNARPVVRTWSIEDKSVILVAEHHAYRRLTQPLVHRRTFFLDKELGTFIIEDFFEGHGEHLFEAFFNLSPDTTPDLCDEGVRLSLGGEPGLVFVTETPGFSLAVEPGWISERYGRKRETRKIVVSGRTTAPLSMRYSFAEAKDGVATRNLKLSLEKFDQVKSTTERNRNMGQQ